MVESPAFGSAAAQLALARLLEAASAKARSRNIAEALSARFATRQSITVLDLSGDTGANLRATAPLLPLHQGWTLIMPSEAAAVAARTSLQAWAGQIKADGGLTLIRDSQTIVVEFRITSPSDNLDALFNPSPQLITISQDAIRYSVAFMRTLAQRCDTERAVVHAAATYAGRLNWTPHHATDSAVTAAYHRYLIGDLGFGLAAGAIAASEFEDQLRLAGFSVLSDDATLVLDGRDATTIAAATPALADLARSNPDVDDARLDAWASRVRSGLRVAQVDLLATPQTG